MSSAPASPSPGLAPVTRILVLLVAAVGFLFDTYELLMFPVIARPALTELFHHLPPAEQAEQIGLWVGRMLWIAALCGGVFGLMGGFLIDRFGRKTIMIASILAYSFSPVAAAFSTELWMFVLFRSTTFIGVCVEFVAAITWLAELFEDKRTRELAIGWTQAFASVGGLFVSVVFRLCVEYGKDLPGLPLPDPFDGHAPWRYTLLTGLVPGALILLLLPFVPESRVWGERKRAGTLRRPRFAELFAPGLIRTTLVTAALSACAYAAAFGALQITPPQIVPGLPELAPQREAAGTAAKTVGQREKLLEGQTGADKAAGEKMLNAAKGELKQKQTELRAASQKRGAVVQLYQEIGGLVGRILLAILVVVIVSRRTLLRIFQVPGLILFPLTYVFLFRDHPDLFTFGIFLCGLVTVAQFSYFGEYLPKAFPVHLRGTGGSFATNVGGRMIGTSGAYLTTNIVAPLLTDGAPTPAHFATAAAIVGGGVFALGLVLSFFLPEPEGQGE